MIYQSIIDTACDTPILKVNCFKDYFESDLNVKLEYFNPSSSIKDRPAINMIREAERASLLKPSGTIIESTSGNVGKALAMAGAALGYKVIIVVDPKTSKLTLDYIRSLGAEIVMVEEVDEDGSYQKTRFQKVQELLKKIPNSFNPDQYNNPDNPRAHELYTSNEIVKDFKRLDSFVACVSTGGHFSGISKALKREYPDITCLAVDSTGSSIISGMYKPYLMNGIGLSWKAGTLEFDNMDRYVQVTDDIAFALCRYFAKETGILIGGSGGAALYGLLMAAKYKNSSHVALGVIPDTGLNYLDQFYNDDWLRSKGIYQLPTIEQIVEHVYQTDDVFYPNKEKATTK